MASETPELERWRDTIRSKDDDLRRVLADVFTGQRRDVFVARTLGGFDVGTTACLVDLPEEQVRAIDEETLMMVQALVDVAKSRAPRLRPPAARPVPVCRHARPRERRAPSRTARRAGARGDPSRSSDDPDPPLAHGRGVRPRRRMRWVMCQDCGALHRVLRDGRSFHDCERHLAQRDQPERGCGAFLLGCELEARARVSPRFPFDRWARDSLAAEQQLVIRARLIHVLHVQVRDQGKTHAGKQKLGRTYLLLQPHLSNRAIAALTGLDDKTVAKYRRELEQGRQITARSQRLDRRGKMQSATKNPHRVNHRKPAWLSQKSDIDPGVPAIYRDIGPLTLKRGAPPTVHFGGYRLYGPTPEQRQHAAQVNRLLRRVFAAAPAANVCSVNSPTSQISERRAA